MPLYKLPSLRTVLGRMADSGWAFLRRAGTLILASMVLVWALLYFPYTAPDGTRYDVEVARLQKGLDSLRAEAEKDGAPGSSKQAVEATETERNALCGQWKRQSWLGRVGRGLEPAVRPLGWDWKIGMAALASFPAREVVVGTLGIIYNTGKDDTEKLVRENKLSGAMQAATWENDPGRKVFTIPTALSLMVFFALCCQCASTLAVIRRETRSWRWPLFTFTYMTVLAYLGALTVYQVGRLFL
jgi:ferrous iron transport protein B